MTKTKKLIIFLVLFFVCISLSILTMWYFNKYDTRDYEHKGFFPLTILKPPWERKIESSQIFKIGIITDTHIHANRIDRKNKEKDAPRVLKEVDLERFKKFNEQMKNFSPDNIVHLGDIIEGTNEGTLTGIKELELVSKELSRSNVPIYWVVGNHDLRSVTKEEFKKTLQIDKLDRVVDKEDYRLIFLDANYQKDNEEISPGNGYVPGHLHQNTLTWLEEMLKTEKRVFVFMHQAAFDRNLIGDEDRAKESIDNAIDLRNMLEKYNVEAIFNGHVEVKFYEVVNGVKYYSLTGTKKSDSYPNSYYELTIKKGIPEIRMFYTTEKGKGEHRIVDFENT